jgi:hypothetical protein
MAEGNKASMSIAQHAQRILAAWNVANPEQFGMELESALHSCQRKASKNIMEIEQQELLESVVERLRDGSARSPAKPSSAQSLSAGFALLRHLSHRVAA